MNSKKLLALAATVAAGMPLAANAGGFYVGAGVGSSSYESSEFLTDFGNQTFSDSDVAYRLFAGYQLTDAVAVEIGWADLGSLKDTISFDDGFGGSFDVNGKIEPSVFDVVAVGTAPIAENFSLFGKIGVAFVSADTSASTIDGAEGSSSTDSQDLTLGGGVQWNIGNFGVRGEVQWYDVEDSDKALVYSVSGLFKFGG